MRITGAGIWGPPDDPEQTKRLLQRVVELGVNLIDTADSYGPEVSENLIAEALHPYPEGLVIATAAPGVAPKVEGQGAPEQPEIPVVVNTAAVHVPCRLSTPCTPLRSWTDHIDSRASRDIEDAVDVVGVDDRR
jgi:aryl-alcohol dehydrogenase-like predicted oxidoreductase